MQPAERQRNADANYGSAFTVRPGAWGSPSPTSSRDFRRRAAVLPGSVSSQDSLDACRRLSSMSACRRAPEAGSTGSAGAADPPTSDQRHNRTWRQTLSRRSSHSATSTKVLHSNNFSAGVAALSCILEFAAPMLRHSAINTGVTETHHGTKKTRRVEPPKLCATCLQREFPTDQVIHSIRTGEVIGKHDITFFGSDDEHRHSATTPKTAACSRAAPSMPPLALPATGTLRRVSPCDSYFRKRFLDCPQFVKAAQPDIASTISPYAFPQSALVLAAGNRANTSKQRHAAYFSTGTGSARGTAPCAAAAKAILNRHLPLNQSSGTAGRLHFGAQVPERRLPY